MRLIKLLILLTLAATTFSARAADMNGAGEGDLPQRLAVAHLNLQPKNPAKGVQQQLALAYAYVSLKMPLHAKAIVAFPDKQEWQQSTIHDRHRIDRIVAEQRFEWQKEAAECESQAAIYRITSKTPDEGAFQTIVENIAGTKFQILDTKAINEIVRTQGIVRNANGEFTFSDHFLFVHVPTGFVESLWKDPTKNKTESAHFLNLLKRLKTQFGSNWKIYLVKETETKSGNNIFVEQFDRAPNGMGGKYAPAALLRFPYFSLSHISKARTDSGEEFDFALEELQGAIYKKAFAQP